MKKNVKPVLTILAVLVFLGGCENPYFPRKSGEDGLFGGISGSTLRTGSPPEDPNDPINYIAGLKSLTVNREQGTVIDLGAFEADKHTYVGFLAYSNKADPGRVLVKGVPLDEALAQGGGIFYKKSGAGSNEYRGDLEGYPFTLDTLYTSIEVTVRVPAENPQAKQTYYVNIVNNSREWPENIKLRKSLGGDIYWGSGGGSGSGGIDTHSDIFIPSRRVTVKPFELAHFETNAALWAEVHEWATDNGYRFRNSGRVGNKDIHDNNKTYASLTDDEKAMPVANVTWYDAVVWCNAYTEWYNNFGGEEDMTGSKTPPAEQYEPVYRLNGQILKDAALGDSTLNGVTADWTKNGYRLPTEVEWEFAARGGVLPTRDSESYTAWSLAYSGSDNLNEVGWFAGNTRTVQKTGLKKINEAFGAYDMSGNVVEWCWDWYVDKGEINGATPSTGPANPNANYERVLRGGGYQTTEAMEYCKVRAREHGPASELKNDVGFRVARSLEAWE
jgi:formylglycine-generating enzyme required for sulfatase activity